MSECASIRERFFASPTLPEGNPELDLHLQQCADCRRIAATLPQVDAALAEVCAPAVPPAFDGIAAAAGAIARSHRRRRRLRRAVPFAVTGLSAAAAVLLAAWLGSTPAPTPIHAGPGSVIDASRGSQRAVLPSGAQMRLDAGRVQLAVTDAGERVHMHSGSVSLRVPHQPPGRTLQVVTPDARVIVHGTEFQVVRDSHGTSVWVSRGLVEVRPVGAGRKPTFVPAGSSTEVKPLGTYRDDLRSQALGALDRGEIATAKASLTALLATQPDRPLAAEAQSLLGWTEAAAGNQQTAIARYRRALAIVPAGERALWVDNAWAQLALLLEHNDPAAAKATWRQYLERFPRGVHADLARAHLAGHGAP